MTAAFDVDAIRAEFPALRQEVRGKPLVYLDNAASTQKPQVVVEAVRRVYEHDYSNIHRGVHTLSVRATEQYEAARDTARRFLGAKDPAEVIFVRGTTEGINLVAQSWGRRNVGPGDEVLVTAMEHHSNIVPWQMLVEERGARLVVADITDDGALDVDDFRRKLSDRTKICAVAHVSNALGTVNPVAELCRLARDAGARVLVDGAQAAPHTAIDVGALGCDFYAMSGHKVYGPTGIGVLWGRRELLEAMPPWQGGGDMIANVTFARTTYAGLPNKLEAGTPHIAGGIALATALDWVTAIGFDRIHAHEQDLLEYGTTRLRELPGLRLVGTAPEKAAVLSFVLDDVHPHDVGTILDFEGVAVRAGHHCAQPVMDRLGVPATTRASLGVYNTRADLDALVRGLEKVHAMFGGR